MAIRAKVGGGLKEKTCWFWVKNGRVLEKCLDKFGSCLQWKKWESMDIFRMLGVSNFKIIVVESCDVNFILFLFYCV